MKNKILALMFGLVIVTGLVACGNSNSQIISDNNIVKEKIQFSWWGNDDRHKYTMDGVDLFQEASNISVDYRYGEWAGYERKNRVWMESHKEADVMQINYAWLTSYSEDGTGYYDINSLRDYIDLSGYDESDLKYGEKNGALNAIPIAFNTSTMCYNQDLFDKYNLAIPESWDDLINAADVFAADNIYVMGMQKKHLLLMLIAYYEQNYNKNFFTNDGKLNINKEELGYILDFYKEMIEKKVLMPLDQFERASFANGEVAASVFWISDADNYCNALADAGASPLFSGYPRKAGAQMSGIYMKPATMYVISNITENPVAAAELVNYLINDEEMILLQGTEKGVPVNKNAVKILEENEKLNSFSFKANEVMQANKDDISIMIPIMESEDIINAFKEGADTYIYNVKTREEAIDDIYSAIYEITNKDR